MIITCKQCATDYYLDEDRIKPSGSKVKCSKCQNLFIAFPPSKSDAGPSTEATQASEKQPADVDIPTSPIASSLAESEDSDMPDLAAGLDELLGADSGSDASLAQLDEEIAAADEIEDQEMHDLTDELDKILGSDEIADQPVEKASEAPIEKMIEPDLEEEDDDLESGFLDDEFDQVFGGDQAEKKTDQTDDTSKAYDTNIEILNLSELDDELDEMFKPELSSVDAGSTDEVNEDILSSEEEIDLDTIQIQDLDSELENIKEIASTTETEIDFGMSTSDNEDVLESEPSDYDGINLDDLDISDPVADETDLEKDSLDISDPVVDETDLEKDSLDISDPVVDETDLEKDSIEDDNNFLDTKQIEKLDLDLDLEYLETQDDESGSSDLTEDTAIDDNFVLDTKQIRSLDLELDLEDLETTDSADAKDKAENDLAEDEDLTLDTLQLEGLELEDIETFESSEEADIALDTQQIEGLDLEFEDLEPSESDTDSETLDEMPSDEKPLSLDTEQIRSLDLELEDIETTEPPTEPEDSFDKDVSITLDTTKGKQTEVLNVNLERPDLDETFNADEEIDLPILDQLLAPAEVIDESLQEGPVDKQLTEPVEDESPGKDLGITEEEDILGLEADEFSIEPESLDLEEMDLDKKAEVKDTTEPEAPATFQDDEIQMETETPAPVESTTTTDTDTFAPLEETEDYYPKKKSRKSLILLLIIALLLAGLYAMTLLGINVPYVSDLVNGKTQQVVDSQGTAQLKTDNIDSKFITNKNDGRLFVITGKVINQYDHARGAILIKGNIFAKGGKLIKGKSSYCGNILSDLDLGAKPFAEIQKYLSNKAGNNGTGSLKVEPGKNIPFMIAFEGLPSDIEEFSVELIHSDKL